MGRLIVVSNRTPALGERTQPAGGLTVGLNQVVQARESLWFGWSGQQTADADTRPVQIETEGGVSYVTFDLTPDQYTQFYLNFSNGVLWPLCHYRTDLICYHRADEREYYAVNERFADRLEPELLPSDTIWVHDYHLFPLGRALRDRGVSGRIGFFLHIPFPPWSVARVMPRIERLLADMSAYDRIGVQTQEDAANLEGCFAACGVNAVVEACPIGIEPETFRQKAIANAGSGDVFRTLTSFACNRFVIGVDRLDYSKGIPERLRGFARLLELHPQYRGLVTFLQVTPVSRAGVESYRALKMQIDELVGSINGRFGTAAWTPVRYTTHGLPRDILAGLYRHADIALVTPRRDGMNLVAKEFVAAQDENDPGVLVLSRMAGAAPELANALQVNPLDVDAVAEALHNGLSMDRDDRRAAWSAMFAEISRNTAGNWARQFLESLETTRR